MLGGEEAGFLKLTVDQLGFRTLLRPASAIELSEVVQFYAGDSFSRNAAPRIRYLALRIPYTNNFSPALSTTFPMASNTSTAQDTLVATGNTSLVSSILDPVEHPDFPSSKGNTILLVT